MEYFSSWVWRASGPGQFTVTMPFYVYLLKSLKDNRYYIGQTNNLERRLKEHNNGEVASTTNRRPFKLIGYEVYSDRNKARYREYKIKRHSGRKNNFIRELTKGRAQQPARREG